MTLRKNVRAWCFGLAAAAGIAMPGAARAQFGEEWSVFQDPETGAVCGVVNTSNAELTVVADTGEVIRITGRDTRLDALLVDDDNNVYYNGFAAGRMVYADDADGYPTVFWITDRETVVQLDARTGQPLDSGLFPEEIGNTGCDPCDSIDDDPFCDRDGADGGGFRFGPLLCGAGAAPALWISVVALPLVGRTRRRRRRPLRTNPLLDAVMRKTLW